MTVIAGHPTDIANSRSVEGPRSGAPKTVLYLIDELCRLGGAEGALLRIVRDLPREKFRPLVATFRYSQNFPLDSVAAPLHFVPLRKTYDLTALRAARALRHLIRDEQVQITHCFFETSDLWGGLVAKWAGCPFLISSRRDMGILANWKHRFGYRIISPIFDQVQTVSEQVRRFAIARDRLRPDRVVTIHNGIDLDPGEDTLSRVELRAKLGIPASSAIVISVANLRPIKGLEVLLRAAAIVCRSRPDTVFLIVGDAPDPVYLQELRQLAASLGISHCVRFWGPDALPARLLRAADVFALLSHNEGFSNAIIEAMAQQLPCVVTDVGGNAEAVQDGHNGWLVARADHAAAADRMLALLDDAETRRRMGAAGLALVERQFTTTAMIQRLTACYEGLLH